MLKLTRDLDAPSKNVMPIIPVDLLPDIFQNFNNDRQAIYNCVFVNRTFCRVAIRFLWQDPFGIKKSTWPFTNGRAAANIISLYLACLNYQDGRNFLSTIKIPHQRPTFNYPQFLRYFDEQRLYIYIRSGQSYNNNLGELAEAYNIHSAIKKLVLRESQALHYLLFETYIFEKMPCNLTNLRHIQFNTPSDVENVANLIRHQLFLESFIISSLVAGLNTLFDALATQIRTLKHLEFIQCDFSRFDWANHAQVLEGVNKLVLEGCTNLPPSMIENLSIFKEKQNCGNVWISSRNI
ncbi:5382_t:CDS:1 [Ambispora leptoticha]|uniref:5382_t:CDS:1 n=1 Tax=Ambispora leptoticha TaxID=144679 RepID=A0A9N9F8U5_9GLOM|nr:5382_t:CDS:1 [Ambispora leptoticha]